MALVFILMQATQFRHSTTSLITTTRKLTVMPLPLLLQVIATILLPSATLVRVDKSFSNACSGGQVGNAVPDGSPFELYNLQSMSGYLIAWKSIHQKQMALSSFEAEIVATNKCTKKLQSIRFHAQDTRPKNV
jgi:hypothetical protein